VMEMAQAGIRSLLIHEEPAMLPSSHISRESRPVDSRTQLSRCLPVGSDCQNRSTRRSDEKVPILVTTLPQVDRAAMLWFQASQGFQLLREILTFLSEFN
jgi:hypothetical protein